MLDRHLTAKHTRHFCDYSLTAFVSQRRMSPLTELKNAVLEAVDKLPEGTNAVPVLFRSPRTSSCGHLVFFNRRITPACLDLLATTLPEDDTPPSAEVKFVIVPSRLLNSNGGSGSLDLPVWAETSPDNAPPHLDRWLGYSHSLPGFVVTHTTAELPARSVWIQMRYVMNQVRTSPARLKISRPALESRTNTDACVAIPQSLEEEIYDSSATADAAAPHWLCFLVPNVAQRTYSLICVMSRLWVDCQGVVAALTSELPLFLVSTGATSSIAWQAAKDNRWLRVNLASGRASYSLRRAKTAQVHTWLCRLGLLNSMMHAVSLDDELLCAVTPNHL